MFIGQFLKGNKWHYKKKKRFLNDLVSLVKFFFAVVSFQAASASCLRII